MFSSASFAEWKKVHEHSNGDDLYVEFENIRKHGEYVYFWFLIDYLKPTPFGKLSIKMYRQSDCKLFRFRTLSRVFHNQPMGRGAGDSQNPEEPEWLYPPPHSESRFILETVCDHVK